MKNIVDIFNENKVDSAIDAALKAIQTEEDREALGEALYEKFFSNSNSDLFIDVIDGMGRKAKDGDVKAMFEQWFDSLGNLIKNKNK